MEIPKKQGIDIREALLAFHREYYSANLMTLVIVGQESVDQLEAWAREFFSGVPNTNANKPTWSETGLPPAFLKVSI